MRLIRSTGSGITEQVGNIAKAAENESTVGQFSSLVDFLSDQMSTFLSLFGSLNDTHSVFGALRANHEFLDTLPDREG